jgi:DNA-binding transcriptional LysR family regulator
MEPADMNPASPEDARLEALLRDAAPPLPDEGFSRQVLAALPPRRRQTPWRTIAYGVAGATALVMLGLALLPVDQTRGDLVRLFGLAPRFTSSLWLLAHPDLKHVARIRTFADFLFERLREDPRLAEFVQHRVAVPDPANATFGRSLAHPSAEGVVGERDH